MNGRQLGSLPCFLAAGRPIVLQQQSSFDPEVLSLLALTAATMANTSRALGERRKAEEHFRYARYLVREHEVTEAAILACIDDLEGSLRKDQRRLAEAEALFTRAVMFYQLADSRLDVACVLLNLGATYNLQGRIAEAIEVARSGLI